MDNKTPSHILERRKKYYRENKERLRQYQIERHNKLRETRTSCECGKSFYLHNKDRHEVSRRHLKYFYYKNKNKK